MTSCYPNMLLAKQFWPQTPLFDNSSSHREVYGTGVTRQGLTNIQGQHYESVDMQGHYLWHMLGISPHDDVLRARAFISQFLTSPVSRQSSSHL